MIGYKYSDDDWPQLSQRPADYETVLRERDLTLRFALPWELAPAQAAAKLSEVTGFTELSGLIKQGNQDLEAFNERLCEFVNLRGIVLYGESKEGKVAADNLKSVADLYVNAGCEVISDCYLLSECVLIPYMQKRENTNKALLKTGNALVNLLNDKQWFGELCSYLGLGEGAQRYLRTVNYAQKRSALIQDSDYYVNHFKVLPEIFIRTPGVVGISTVVGICPHYLVAGCNRLIELILLSDDAVAIRLKEFAYGGAMSQSELKQALEDLKQLRQALGDEFSESDLFEVTLSGSEMQYTAKKIRGIWQRIRTALLVYLDGEDGRKLTPVPELYLPLKYEENDDSTLKYFGALRRYVQDLLSVRVKDERDLEYTGGDAILDLCESLCGSPLMQYSLKKSFMTKEPRLYIKAAEGKYRELVRTLQLLPTTVDLDLFLSSCPPQYLKKHKSAIDLIMRLPVSATLVNYKKKVGLE